ncbi:MAG TPA: acetylglutamate kinase [Chloroflexota bacterium]|nr:acetylglutamate kinase [Chloroflexota bacterium]
MGESDLAAMLAEALPYVSRYIGKTIVVKLGGSALGQHDTTIEDVVICHRLGIRIVLVHGGGNAISQWLKRVGKEPRFVKGLRVTDDETMDLVTMTLAGQVNKQLVAEIQRLGGQAIGLCGLDGGMLRARPVDPELGRVGEVYQVDLKPLHTLIAAGYIPVVAPIALGADGKSLNLNADTAAAELAAALRATKAIFLTDVPGVLDAERQLISALTASGVRALIAEGVISGGMIPKVEACLRALAGVERSHIVDGRVAHALIRELFTDRGVGTMISDNVAAQAADENQEVDRATDHAELART